MELSIEMVKQQFDLLSAMISKQTHLVDAIIDTGFTGYLTLPLAAIHSLNLQLYSREEGMLGDGSRCIFDVYVGLVIWDGEYRYIDINAAETDPLVGMSLLYDYRLQIDVVEGGIVTIQALSS
jgi:clan AA aspartic protease